MIDAQWLEAYDKLSSSDRDLFAREVNTLLARTFLVRDRYDSAVGEIRASAAYRFVDRHFDLFSDYLALAGWHLSRTAITVWSMLKATTARTGAASICSRPWSCSACA